MGDKFSIVLSECGRVCAGAGFCAGVFCVE